MKVYDGAGLIAEKSAAMVVPVRVEGPEATIFSRLSREQTRRRWFPKFTLTILEPVRLTVDDALKGKTRRIAAGSALYEKFGIRILEGYDVTETSPVLALNTPMFNRFGTVGRLIPGIEHRLDPVPGVNDGGRLFVREPNIMLRYLKIANPNIMQPPQQG